MQRQSTIARMNFGPNPVRRGKSCSARRDSRRGIHDAMPSRSALACDHQRYGLRFTKPPVVRGMTGARNFSESDETGGGRATNPPQSLVSALTVVVRDATETGGADHDGTEVCNTRAKWRPPLSTTGKTHAPNAAPSSSSQIPPSEQKLGWATAQKDRIELT